MKMNIILSRIVLLEAQETNSQINKNRCGIK